MSTAVTTVFADDDRSFSHEYLTFTLGKEEYALDILNVQEIRGYEEPTRIANAPAFIKGVVNLRGVIVPIVDMRIKFGIEDVQYTDTTVVIILNVGGRVVGMVVDSVSDVLELNGHQIRQAPQFSASVGAQYVLGLATIDDRMLIVTDIEKVMFAPDMGLTDVVLEA
jgi:purine-binding chemotaxis protein CheW